MRLRLLRSGETEIATPGRLVTEDRELVLPTLEQPWWDNRPFLSCIPPGFYALEPYVSQSSGPTWRMVGETVGAVKADLGGAVTRYGCQLDRANHARQLQGCVAPGRRMGRLGDELAVMRSGDALAALRKVLVAGERHYLTIEAAPDA